MFLEVTDSRAPAAADWSCFVSHRLSVVNQRHEERSVSKESQNRYSKAAKDWGWREFVTLTSLFDQDSGVPRAGERACPCSLPGPLGGASLPLSE